MKKLASILAAGTLLATAACTQTPPPQPPPPQPPIGASMGCPMGCQGQMMAMHHMGMEHHEEMRGEPPRPPWHGRRMMHHGPEGDRAVMRELAMLGVHLYPPPMLIKRAQQIGLTQDQIAKIRQEVLGAQARSVDLKAKIEKAKVESMRLLAADKVDQKAVDAQIDEAAKAGAELRKLHVGVMLHVRDVLTPEQLKKLDELRPPKTDAKPGGPGPGPGKQAMDDDDDDDDDDDEG